MELKDFLDSLDKKNRQYEDLEYTMRRLAETHGLLTARKDSSLVETIKNYLETRKLFPLVDNKLKMVFGVRDSCHLLMRIELFRYHLYAKNPSAEYINPNKAADDWVSKGMGYYFASTPTMMEAMLKHPPRRIIAAEGYRPDKLDEELFSVYEVDHVL